MDTGRSGGNASGRCSADEPGGVARGARSPTAISRSNTWGQEDVYYYLLEPGAGHLAGQCCPVAGFRLAQAEQPDSPGKEFWTVPVSSRQIGPFSRYSGTMESDVVVWQGRQIVQS